MAKPAPAKVRDQMSLPTRLPKPKRVVEVPDPEGGVGAAKVFRAYDPDQILLLPPDLSSWLPAGHLPRLVSDLIENVLDMSPIYASYKESRGSAALSPKLLLKLLLYGYATGPFSSRRLERAAHELVPCRYLAADHSPSTGRSASSGAAI